MRGTVTRKIKQTVTREKRQAIESWCNFVNEQPLKRRIKLAFIVIKGNVSIQKLDTI